MPLVKGSDPGEVREALHHEFPHLRGVIDDLLADVVGRDVVRLRQTLLVGSPGGGRPPSPCACWRSWGLSPVAYPWGGTSDSSFAGTARRWSSAEPCLPLTRVLATGIANPGLVLDEIDKAGTSRHNGTLVDSLLALLERQTAKTFMNPYVQAPVDLSHVTWIATANGADTLPAPMRDRFRIVRVPEPTAADLVPLSRLLMHSLVVERGLDPCWASPLDGTELSMLSEVWLGGSLRSLARYLGVILAARDRPHGVTH